MYTVESNKGKTISKIRTKIMTILVFLSDNILEMFDSIGISTSSSLLAVFSLTDFVMLAS